MRLILIVLFAAAPALFASEPAARAPFPDDYVPQECAAAHSACSTFNKYEFARFAGLRGYTVPQSWIDAHWDELMAALKPYCAKAAACFANPVNEYTWCNDVVEPAGLSLCSIYPPDSEDARFCDFISRTMWTGWDRTSKPAWQAIQSCAATAPAAPGEKMLDIWMTPASFDSSYDGMFILHALDAVTRIPVQALVSFEGQRLRATDTPGGKPYAGLAIRWPLGWNRVPAANGHQKLAPPTVTVSARGYQTVTFPLPMPAPKLLVEMQPARLKRGRNRVTITARDATSGKPVEMRVMGGASVLGRSNEPFDLELTSSKPPEIWLTSLFDHYDDVVVVEGRKR